MGREAIAKETLSPPERAFLVGVDWKSRPEGRYVEHAWSAAESLAELERLAETAGLEVIGKSTQRLDQPHPATFVGKGKAEEIAGAVHELGADVVIFDDELSPRHQRELEAIFGDKVKVLDRTGLILDIFALHANTREGALQVELAQYEYRLPRLTQAWTDRAYSQQTGGRAGGATGGVGLRGPGETRLELDRRIIRRRIAQIERDLEEVRAHRARHRRQRRRGGLPSVALVGYTNAGKSTLLNALSGSEIYVADELFATLDPTIRRVDLPGGTAILITDTVGFIQKLPTTLIAAFRATLEEVQEADLLLHVIDASHPQAREQARAVYDTLQEISASDIPLLTALNKVDRFEDPQAAGLALYDLPNTVAISALTGYGLETLKLRLEEALEAEMARVKVQLPFDRGDLVSLFHERGLIQTEEYQEQGTYIVGRIPHLLLPQFEAYQVKARRR
ncbi:MAG TPA: GTPase HflX [Anaerolineae bacterium]|nr:MAG: GTPase HflX [Chloroflexi bacterium ADurb.Bin222]HOC21710.1 GTPase HflX [Anaerolineae bacterium]HQM14594.1 GTPase HflX [Anaerolineae bacterium]